MTFVQLEFLAFFVVVFAVYWAVPLRRVQNVWLAASSLVFYGWIHPWFVLLLLYSATLNWGAAMAMTARPPWRLAILRFAILGNVLLLGTFKYLDFLIANVAAAIQLLGFDPDLHTLGILLPVGISFYTFQTLSYTLDVYLGKVQPERSFLTFVCYVAFFPQLVAGPIERAGELLPQFHTERTLDVARFRSGVSLVAWGLVKKTVIADTLAPYVNAIYATDAPSNAMAWAAALAFMIQILADFSAYTDIARGTARLLGFELRKNFDHPYAAASPEEFWRRWHITFSEWLRDYVHLPLYDWKGLRRWVRVPGLPDDFKMRLARASFFTMLFSGLWHGAAWHFVLWGAWWGLLQVIWIFARPLKAKNAPWRWWLRPAGIALMLGLNLVAHQIFREPYIARLPGRLFGNPFAGTHEELVVATLMLAMALAAAAFLLVATVLRDRVVPRIQHLPVWLPIETGLWAVAGWATYTFAWQSNAEFIYFQF